MGVCTPPSSASISPSSTQNICNGETVLLTANTVNGYLYRWYRNGSALGAATVDDNTYLATTSGSYTVRIGDGDVADNACYLESSGVTVNMNSLPAANITTSNLDYCNGDNGVTLNATSVTGATYEWFLGGASQGGASSASSYSNAMSGNWTVEVTNSGCSDISASVTVVEIGMPLANITTTFLAPSTAWR